VTVGRALDSWTMPSADASIASYAWQESMFSMLHQVKNILLFVLRYFISWTYLSVPDVRFKVSRQILIERNEEYRMRNSMVEIEIQAKAMSSRAFKKLQGCNMCPSGIYANGK